MMNALPGIGRQGRWRRGDRRAAPSRHGSGRSPGLRGVRGDDQAVGAACRADGQGRAGGGSAQLMV